MSASDTAVLPPSWSSVNLGAIRKDRGSTVTPSNTPAETFELYSVPSFETGIPELVRGSEIGSSKQLVEPDTVLICKINPRINRAWKVAEARGMRQLASTEWIAFPKVDAVDPDYLRYFFTKDEFRNYLAQNVSGVGGSLMRVRPAVLDPYRLPLAPLHEQKRIVAKIDELFSQIDEGERNLKRVQTLLKQYRQSVLKAAVTGELTRDWRAKNVGKGETGADLLKRILVARREAWEAAELKKLKAKGKIPKNDDWKKKYVEPVPPDTSNLAKLPDGWVWATLETLVDDVRTGPFGSLLHKEDYVVGGTPLVNPMHIVDRKIVPDERNSVDSATLERLQKYTLSVGDVVIARRGEMGRCATVTKAEDGWLCGTGSSMIRPGAHLRGEFLTLTISAEHSRRHLEDGSVGTTMSNLGQDALYSLPIALPTLDEQSAVEDAIASEESRIAVLESWLAQQVRESKVLRQSILRSAFAGELVPQNSSDEPASELLKRIGSSEVNDVVNREAVSPTRGRQKKNKESVAA